MKQSRPFIFLLLCFLIVHDGNKPANALTITQWTISDLETGDSGSFAYEVSLWSISSTVYWNNRFNYCDGYILGGPYGLGRTDYWGNWYQSGDGYTRTYTNLPTHSMVILTITFWAIDSWDWSPDRFEVTVSGVPGFVGGNWYMGRNYNGPLSYNPWIYTNNCNGNRPYMRVKLFSQFAHSSTSLTLQITSRMDEGTNNESFGFRDVKLVFSQDAPSTYYCGAPLYTSYPFTGYINNAYGYTAPTCGCPQATGCAAGCSPLCPSTYNSCFGSGPNQCYDGCYGAANYVFDGINCVQCHASCATCFGAGANQCNTCANTYFFLSWTNECVSGCPWPARTPAGTTGTCILPTCGEQQYLAQDGVTCINDCPAPYLPVTQHSVLKMCLFPCNPVDYAYWDGSCQQECPSPLTVTRSTYGGNVCNFNCDPSQYLYWNGTCGSTCEFPLISRTLNSRMICLSPCPSNQNLLPDNKCITTCPTYLPATTIGAVSYCAYPCKDNEYLNWDFTCKTTCHFPLTTRIEHSKQYCDYPTNIANFLYWDGSSNVNCNPPLTPQTIVSGSYTRKFCSFKCNDWEYLYWDGSCVSECPYPLTSRISNSRLFCDYSCTGTTSMDWDRNCLASCNFPLAPRTQYGKDFCDYPCGPTEYLYADGTCGSTCSQYYLPRTSGVKVVKQFCDYPCKTSPNLILWDDGTCKDSCNVPMVTTHQYGDPYCSFICENEEEYYNYDGTCKTYCDSPYVPKINGIQRYCDFPCSADTQYYYYNGTCQTGCLPPLQARTLNGVKWCVFPCFLDQYLLPDGSCSDSCELPLLPTIISTQLKVCNTSCISTEYIYWNGTCHDKCKAPYRTKNETYGALCLQPCDDPMHYWSEMYRSCVEDCPTPAQDRNSDYLRCILYIDYGLLTDIMLNTPDDEEETSFVVPSILLQYVRYLDIDMPLRLGNFTLSKGRNPLTLRYGQTMPESLISTFTLRPLPNVFKRVGLHSNFIVNFWKELSSWIIIIVFALLFSGFERICDLREWTNLKIFFEKLRIITRWNILLILITTSVGDIILYIFLELMSLDQGFSISYISIEFCILMMGLTLVLLFGAFYVGRNFHYVKEKVIMFHATSNYLEFQKSWEGYQVMYRGFRDYRNPNQYFTLLYMLRLMFPMLITILFYRWPIVQTVFYSLFSFLIMFYILKKKPLIRTLSFIQLIFVESVITIANICLFILVIQSNKGQSKKYFSFILADIVIFGNSCINLAGLVFLAAKVLETARAIYRYQGKTSKTIWLQLVTYVFQQGGYGFEEMYVEEQAKEILYNPKYLIEDEDAVAKSERDRLRKERMADLNGKSGNVDGLRKDKLSSFFARPSSQETDIDSKPETPLENGPTYKLNKVIDPRLRLINETRFNVHSPSHRPLMDLQSPTSFGHNAAHEYGFGEIRRLDIEKVAPVEDELHQTQEITVLQGKPPGSETRIEEESKFDN